MKRFHRLLLAPAAVALLTLAASIAHAQAPPGAAARVAPGPLVVQVSSAADGKAVAGVLVLLGRRYATTTPDGAATFDGVPEGRYKLAIEQVGFDRLEQEVNLPAGARQPIPLAIRPAVQVRVTGKVILEGDGRPVVGARVALIPTDVPAAVEGRFDFTTGWEGEFTIVEVPQGAWRAEVSAPGCTAKTFDLTVAPDHAEAKFELARESEVAGVTVTVQDAEGGAPLVGAKVSLAEAWPKGMIAEGTTDAEGKASFAGLRIGRLNWIEESGKVAICRREATVRVEAEGYETTLVPVALQDGAGFPVAVNSCAKIVEQEPNDALASAQVIRTGAPVEFAIAKPGDHDCFRFRVKEPARVGIELQTNATLSITLLLFDADGHERARWSAGPNQKPTFDAGPLAAGDYLVQAQEYYDSGANPAPISLRILCDWAADPQEPNDSPQAARPLRSGEEARGCLLPAGDHDVYRFETRRPCHVRVTSTHHALTRTLILFNDRGEEITRASFGPDGGHLEAPLAPGAYTIRVQEYYDSNTSTEPYSIRLEEIDDDGIDDPAQSPGPVRSVRSLPSGGQLGATILPPGDADAYTVSVPCAGRVHAYVTAPPEYSITLLARDAKGNEIGRASCGPNATTEVAWFVPGPTMAGLQVSGYYNSESSVSPYVVRASFEPCDELEAIDRNEAPDAATPIDLGEEIRADFMPGGDSDCYRVDVDHAGVLRIEGVTPPVSFTAYVLDGRQKEVVRWSSGPNVPYAWEVPVLAGEHFILLREYYNTNAHPCPYSLRVTLRRVEPQEREPLRDDPIRTLTAGEAQAFWIDQGHDLDRFSFDMPEAGKVRFRMRAAVSFTVTIFDDRTGGQVARESHGPNSDLALELEAKGPTRYRVEAIEYYDSNASPGPGYVMMDTVDRPYAAGQPAGVADPCDPTRVTFSIAEVPGLPLPSGTRIDCDGDGKADLEVAAGGQAEWRYRSEGLYAATAWLADAGGATTRVPFWVEASGPRERKGVHVVVDRPAEGQVVDEDSVVCARAMSYTGARIARVSAAVDGAAVPAASSAPWVIEVPWGAIDAGEHVLSVTATDAKGEAATLESAASRPTGADSWWASSGRDRRTPPWTSRPARRGSSCWASAPRTASALWRGSRSG